MIYIELSHGRHTPDEEIDDWGFDGPVLGPYPFFHMTYLSTINTGKGPTEDMGMENEYITYMGAYYGDASILSELDSPALKERWERTQAILKADAVTLINHQDEWVKHYALTRLRKGENDARGVI